MNFHLEIHGITRVDASNLSNPEHPTNLITHLEKEGFDKNEFRLTATTNEHELDIDGRGVYVRVYLIGMESYSLRVHIARAIRSHCSPKISVAEIQFMPPIEARRH